MKKSADIMLVVGICLLYTTLPYAENRIPETLVLDSLANMFEPVIFAHAVHIRMDGNCAGCHHEHATEAASTCIRCHAITSSAFRRAVINGFSGCQMCHVDPDPINPGMPGLKVAYHRQCFKCHRGMADVGIDPAGCTNLCHARKGPSEG